MFFLRHMAQFRAWHSPRGIVNVRDGEKHRGYSYSDFVQAEAN